MLVLNCLQNDQMEEVLLPRRRNRVVDGCGKNTIECVNRKHHLRYNGPDKRNSWLEQERFDLRTNVPGSSYEYLNDSKSCINHSRSHRFEYGLALRDTKQQA